MAYKIYQVFNTATDAYLEYVNNFLSKEVFTDYYELDESEVDNLFLAAQETKELGSSWVTLDYHFNKLNNEEYSEKNIHW